MYSQAASSCFTFVGVRSKSLTSGDFRWVRYFLEDRLPVGGSAVPPQVQRMELKDGLVKVVCSNDYTKKWVEEQITSFEPGWLAGAKTLFRPPLKRYSVAIEEGKSVERFLELVAYQNPGFLRLQLRLWHSSRLPSGDTLAVFGIGEEMVQFLERRQGRVYCGMGQVVFRSKDTVPPSNSGPGPRPGPTTEITSGTATQAVPNPGPGPRPGPSKETISTVTQAEAVSIPGPGPRPGPSKETISTVTQAEAVPNPGAGFRPEPTAEINSTTVTRTEAVSKPGPGPRPGPTSETILCTATQTVPNPGPRPGPATKDDLEALFTAARASAKSKEEAASLDHLSSRVRAALVSSSAPVVPTPASSGLVPPGTVMAAVAAVERLSSRSDAVLGAQAPDGLEKAQSSSGGGRRNHGRGGGRGGWRKKKDKKKKNRQ